MRIQRKSIAALIAINMFASIAVTPITTMAESDYIAAERVVNLSLNEKTFYHYNQAYQRIMELPAGYERDILLSKLSTIANDVWTKDIAEIVHLIEVMANEKSGRSYDNLEARINNVSLKEIDKQYLLSELSSWGRDTVWTEDYKKAIAPVVELWSNKTKEVYREAERAIRELNLSVNKEYITELLNEAKAAVGFAPITLGDNYFTSTNTSYIGQGKSVYLDLSKDTTAKTIILKDNFEDLYINAPKETTVILEDAGVESLTLLDLDSDIFLMRGNTAIQALVVDDKDNDTNIVMEGNSTVTSAEIRRGATIDVSSNQVSSPFGKLKLNIREKKEVRLLGNFKTSNVDVEKSTDLKVDGIIKKIDIREQAKGTTINILEKSKVSEVQTEASIKVEGPGNLETIKADKPLELDIDINVEKIEIFKEAKDTNINIGEGAKVNIIDSGTSAKVDGKGELGVVIGSGRNEVESTIPASGESTTPPSTIDTEDTESDENHSGSGSTPTKLEQSAPTGLSGVSVTIAGNDGKITGTTAAMEYRLKGDTDFIAVTGTEITGLSAGTYEVRYAAKTGYNAGTTVEVIVETYAEVFVSDIDITSAGDISTVLESETLQLSAVVTPSNATNKTVTWEVNTLEGGTAIIDPSTGYLQAIGAGTVMVTATNVASGVTGTKVITITEAPTTQAMVDAEKEKITVSSIGILEDNDNVITKAQALVTEGYAVNIVSSTTPSAISLDGIVTGTVGSTTSSAIVFQVGKDGITSNTEALNLIVAAKAGQVEQPAPTGLIGIAPTFYGLSDGKITGTIALMEYKLSTEDTYTAATETEITGLAAGIYNVRFAARPGFNAGAAVEVVVEEGAVSDTITSKAISNLDFSTIYASGAKIVSKTITSSNFSSPNNKSFTITDAKGDVIPVNLSWNIVMNEYTPNLCSCSGICNRKFNSRLYVCKIWSRWSYDKNFICKL